ncbi:MAG: tetratricopeptide repeat protein, partial [Sphaerospermopsis sp. SIO1G2]|nr:tetratricopeptide repeat protein [Sphaerospermopsis sp. SIO1G2]
MANKYKNTLLILLKLISLPGIISILFLCEPVTATPINTKTVAQQTQTREIKKAADKAFVEAMKLFKKGTAESLKQAIRKLQLAAKLYEEVGEKISQALSLVSIGIVYDSLGEKQQALQFFNQALPIFRAVGDRGGEANILKSIGLVYSSLGEIQKALQFYNRALP